ncbi:MAG: hypothetical protein NC314_04340 [Roseburia sp.]|nr:hypothetical protein [Ruminococcus sp.]MCM1155914.1 hypothetical protein [Roseburia sp.]MCM1242048.1 hypothetical protein [Roseburia sp.]
MADFKGTADTISTIKETLDMIQTTLEDTLTRAETIQSTLNDETIWAGEAQLVGAAFLDLVVQYHEKLAPAEDGPVSQASKSLQEYLDTDDVFYENWQDHVDLEGI